MAENPEKLALDVDKLTKQVEKLTKLVETPDSGAIDRISAIETEVADLSISDNTLGDVAAPPEHPPDIKVDFIPERKTFGGDVIPFQIEFGKPTADVTTDVATVALQPCAEDETSFTDAGTVTVYIANDRQVQDTKNRGWTTASVLSFIRFSPWVSGVPIEGVLIGEPILQYPDVEGVIASEMGLLHDEWYDVQADAAWFTIDSRNWSNRFVEVALIWDGGAPSDSGSWSEDNGGIAGSNVQHAESLIGVWTDQEVYKWFRLYLKGGGVAQNISKLDMDVGGSGTTVVTFQMETDGTLEMQVTEYSTRVSVRICIRAFRQVNAANAIAVT